MSLYQRLDIYKRLNQLDAITQKQQKLDVSHIFYYEDADNYFIMHNGKDFYYDNLDDFYKDKGLDKSNKKHLIYNFRVVKNRTEDDIYD